MARLALICLAIVAFVGLAQSYNPTGDIKNFIKELARVSGCFFHRLGNDLRQIPLGACNEGKVPPKLNSSALDQHFSNVSICVAIG